MDQACGSRPVFAWPRRQQWERPAKAMNRRLPIEGDAWAIGAAATVGKRREPVLVSGARGGGILRQPAIRASGGLIATAAQCLQSAGQ
jgi:hypothetical protein